MTIMTYRYYVIVFNCSDKIELYYLLLLISGPGPGRYSLPSTVGYIDHDISKHKKPAYMFGKRLLDPGMARNPTVSIANGAALTVRFVM